MYSVLYYLLIAFNFRTCDFKFLKHLLKSIYNFFFILYLFEYNLLNYIFIFKAFLKCCQYTAIAFCLNYSI